MTGIASSKIAIPLFEQAASWTSKDNSMESEIYARGAYLCAIPISMSAAVVDLCIGIIISIGAIFTLGRGPGKKAFLMTVNQFKDFGYLILAFPFNSLLRIIKPSNKIGALHDHPRTRFVRWGEEKSIELISSANPFLRHIASRAVSCAILVSLILIRGTEIGIPKRIQKLVFGNAKASEIRRS